MDFYWLNILLSFFAAILYASFRSGIYAYLRLSKNSKTFIKKSKKGFLNFWFYKKLKRELGYAYHLNLTLFFGTVAYTLIALSLAWIEILHLPIAIIYALLCTLQITTQIFSDINYNKHEYGTPFILWRKGKAGRVRSSIQDIIVIIGLIAFAVSNIWLAVN